MKPPIHQLIVGSLLLFDLYICWIWVLLFMGKCFNTECAAFIRTGTEIIQGAVTETMRHILLLFGNAPKIFGARFSRYINIVCINICNM